MTWNSLIIILHTYLRNWLGFPAQSRFKLDSFSENLKVVARGKCKESAMRSDSPDKKRQEKKKKDFKTDTSTPKILVVWHNLVQFGNLEGITTIPFCNNSHSKHLL